MRFESETLINGQDLGSGYDVELVRDTQTGLTLFNVYNVAGKVWYGLQVVPTKNEFFNHPSPIATGKNAKKAIDRKLFNAAIEAEVGQLQEIGAELFAPYVK